MPTLSYDMSSSTGLTLTQTEVTGGVAKLATTTHTDLAYDKTYDSDTGITYNSNLTEFTGSVVRQKDQLPSVTLFASYESSKDADIAAGSTTGTLVGNAAVSGGALVLDGTGGYCTYAAASNADFTQTGAIKIRVVPGYSGTPGADNYLFHLAHSSGTPNEISLRHGSGDGKLALLVRNNVGGVIADMKFGASAWSPVSGTAYNMEVDVDLTTGATRLFINGTQHGSTDTSTGTHTNSSTTLTVGAKYDGTSAFLGSVSYVSVHSAVLHTANFSDNYDITHRYMNNLIHTTAAVPKDGIGDFLSFNAFSMVGSGTTKFNVNGKYYNGSAWVSSDDTYAQMNTAAELNTNLPSYVTTGMNTMMMKGMSASSNTEQSSVTSTRFEYSSLGYYENGSILFPAFYAEALTSISATEVVSGGVIENTWGLKINGTLKYWNGSAWATSNGTAAQLNSLATINSNIASAVTTNSTVQLYCRMDALVYVAFTPTIDDVSIVYDYGGVNTAASTVLLWGYVRDPSSVAVQSATVTATPLRADSTYFKRATGSVIFNSVSTTTDALGYWELELIPSSGFEVSSNYVITIVKSGVTYTAVITLPSAEVAYNILDVLTGE